MVVDAQSRQPLESANIEEKENATNKSITDQFGNFIIKVHSAKAELVVSYVGYKTSFITIAGKNNLQINLLQDVVNINDVLITTSNGHQKFATLAKIDLDLKPVRNTQELMRIVPGLFVAQHAGGGKAEQIFLRGFDCDHGTDIQVSVDGLPVNMVSHAHGQGYADAHFIIPETVNNIDYGAGPFYTQHGNLNTAGYVNFSTYKNISQSQVQIEVGRFDTYRALVLVDLLKKNKDKQSVYAAGEYNFSNGATLNKQHLNRFNLFGKYNLAISQRTYLTTTASAFKSRWFASGQVPDRSVKNGSIDRFGSIDPTEGGNTERYNALMQLSHAFPNGVNWENLAWFSHYKFNLFSNFTFFLNDSLNGDGINQYECRNLGGFHTKFTKKNIYSLSTWNAIQGAGIRYDATQNSYLSHVVKRRFLNYLKRGNINEYNAFVYSQHQITVGKFYIDAGIRLDYLHFDYCDQLNMEQNPSQGKITASPKLNVQYTMNKLWQIYLKIGKGFHSNDTRVVTSNEGHEILPAAYGADVGFTIKPVKNLFVNVAYWYLFLNQEFVYVGDDGNIEPSGKSQRQGVEILARLQIAEGFFANANVNFAKPRSVEEPKGANYIPLAPTFTSTGGIFYKKKEGFSGGLTYRYIADRPANEDNSIVAKGYFLLDGSVNYTKSNYEVGIAAENILNTNWNEAQFATQSRLQNELLPVTELNYTPGMPYFIRAKLMVFF